MGCAGKMGYEKSKHEKKAAAAGSKPGPKAGPKAAVEMLSRPGKAVR